MSILVKKAVRPASRITPDAVSSLSLTYEGPVYRVTPAGNLDIPSQESGLTP
ncbi:MAG: hypothetical protein JWQ74_1150 [Marmoricola sp.]|nr:hypothetical protein [Marmoricola sp.]